jgi:hypothetical protein
MPGVIGSTDVGSQASRLSVGFGALARLAVVIGSAMRGWPS